MVEKKPENSFIDEAGIIRCYKCKEPLYAVSPSGLKCRVMCACEREEMKRGEDIRAEMAKKAATERRRSESMMGDRYSDARLANVVKTANNAAIVDKARIYIEEAKTVIQQNLGLYIYGENSTGKTFLTSVICNELIEAGYSCLYTNLATLLTQSSLFEEEGDYMRERIAQVDFLFIDDVGKEFIGREVQPDGAKYAERIFFEVINIRYNAQHPTVFSSNYSISQLANELNLDTGIVERIAEMAASKWKLTGDDFREKEYSARAAAARRLGL